jgi:hypothetical protein
MTKVISAANPWRPYRHHPPSRIATRWRRRRPGRCPPLGRAFIWANFIPKLGAVGGLYLAAPTRLCAHAGNEKTPPAGCVAARGGSQHRFVNAGSVQTWCGGRVVELSPRNAKQTARAARRAAVIALLRQSVKKSHGPNAAHNERVAAVAPMR